MRVCLGGQLGLERLGRPLLDHGPPHQLGRTSAERLVPAPWNSAGLKKGTPRFWHRGVQVITPHNIPGEVLSAS